jgi:hypothetical protein
MSHLNNGTCPQCKLIFDRYQGFNSGLRSWFEAFQVKHPEAHISCAGRGEQDQEAAVLRRASRAHYGHSSHNWNAAIDIFEMTSDSPNIYNLAWFKNVLAPELPDWVNWYGMPGAAFHELPHCEVRNWKELALAGELFLVEPKAYHAS